MAVAHDEFIPNPACPWVKATHGDFVRVYAVEYITAPYNDQRYGYYVETFFRKISRYGIEFSQHLPDGAIDLWATQPEFVRSLKGGLFYPDRDQSGPFEIRCGDARVRGLGLPYNQHVVYVVIFQLTKMPPWVAPSG